MERISRILFNLFVKGVLFSAILYSTEFEASDATMKAVALIKSKSQDVILNLKEGSEPKVSSIAQVWMFVCSARI